MTSRINPGTHAFAVTPDDATDITARCLYVGVTGDLKVTMKSGSIVTFKNRPVGDFPYEVNRVWANGTTASAVLGVL